MKFTIFVTILIILLHINSIHGYFRKFLKIENCTTSGKTSAIEECEIKDNKMNFAFRIWNGSLVSHVRFI